MIRLLLAFALSSAVSASAATFNVTNGNDSGPGSLRQALADAGAAAGADTITIDTTVPIILAGTALVVNSEVEIIGNHSTVDAAGLSTVFQVTSSGAGCVTFRGLRITGGDGGSGGGISISTGACVAVVDCAITANRASNGGGILATSATLSVINSSVDRNEATLANGGGLQTSSSTVTLRNVTIAQNIAKTTGGGGFFIGGSAITITNCTITDNLADSDDDGVGDAGGFALASSATVSITNTAVTGNQDTPGNDGSGSIVPNLSTLGGTVTTQGQNFIGRNDGAIAVFPEGSPNGNGDYVGSGVTPISADLTELHGRRLYYTFGQNSLLRDNGDNSANAELTDQRGYPRFNSGVIDIGATEMAFVVVTSVADSGAGSLREAITTAGVQGEGDIVFDFPGPGGPHTIVLGSQLSVTKPLTILGPSAANRQVTISTTGSSRVMTISAVTGIIEVALRDVDLANGSTAVLTGSAARGGALLVIGSETYLFLEKVTISDSTSPSEGGAIAVAVANVSLLDTTITGCEATNNGGAIYGDGKLTLERVTLSDNQAGGHGGGIYNIDTATLLNSTLSGNVADFELNGLGDGGGIYSSSVIATEGVTLSQCTVVGNNGVQGGGLAETGNSYFKVLNTIVAQNIARNGAGEDVEGSFTSLGHNLIGDGTNSTGFTNSVNGDQVGTGASPLDPLLAPLADYGGQTLTRPPLLGSTAIDAGDTEATEFLFVDQKKDPRRHNAEVDIGAAEYIPQLTHSESIDLTAAEVLAPLPVQFGTVRIHRNSDVGSLPVPLTLDPVADAASFTDFLLVASGPGSVSQTASGATATIAAGQTSVLLIVVPLDDSAIEAVEAVVLLPGSDAHSELDPAAPPPAEVHIIDNDFRVTNYANGGVGSLRATINSINASSTGGTILFDNELGTPHPEVINLTSQLNITGAVEILGPLTTRAGITLDGGGVTRVLSISPGARATIRNLTIADGFAASGGGLSMSGTTGVVENCLFVDNVSTGNGGGIIGNSGTLTVTNSTFTNNRANGFGGAVANTVAGGTITLQHCTVAGNIGDEDNNGSGGGGGLADLSGAPNQLRIRSTLIAENVSRSGLGPQLFNAITTLGYNLVTDNTDATVLYPAGTPNGNNDYVGTGVAPLDARIGPLRENGGSTMTHALHFGSPALEHGINTGAPAKDQRDLARPFGAFVDIGAYELRPETFEYWAAHEFGSAAGSAYEDDFDLDGYTNGAEYVMGSDPTTGSSLPHLSVAVAGNQFDVFVSRSPLATLGTNRIATSPDLVTWTLAPLGNYSAVGIAPGDVNGELVRMRMIMTPGTLRMFARAELLP